ncbi:hypothetical protein [Acinetobacter sp. ANC 4862]|uniref:hypothetical protein n=1 Tax=Acinetobacter sp. ANC 4862 TaxID=2529849 RepID=UPI00103BDF18|nr:hypothetical protein [Acinetobacter sp. ANC 4862]TCH62157.1 hypothetical protein E0409_13650 [Acinetobacter sp. ANC 4862]
MLRLLSTSIICLGLMTTGCATTKKLASKVSLGSSDTPLQQVLKARPDLRKDSATVEIRQYFNSAESPTAAQVKVTETGLKDDSVRSIRTTYSFKNVEGDWKKTGMQTEYQCQRSKNSKAFQTAKCP